MKSFLLWAILLLSLCSLAVGQHYQVVGTLGSENFKHDTPVRGVAFSPDGKYMLSGQEKNIIVWDRNTGKRVSVIDQVEHGSVGLKFSPSGKFLAIEDSC